MSEAPHPIIQLLQRDRRYKLEAYQFVRESLSYAQEVLSMGERPPAESLDESDPDSVDTAGLEELALPDELVDEEMRRVENHLSGQQLCQAIRQNAVEQFGYMAKAVLNSWGVHSTSDFGEIVYNMIDVGLMKKSKSDRREDFNDVYDFEEALLRDFQINTPSDSA